jgi:hypothetical protein
MTTALAAHTDLSPSVSERLAAHVVDLRFEDLPSDVVNKAKDY